MTQPFDEGGKELRELFFETTQELLQTLNDDSLKLEQSPGNQEIVRSIRRTVHTIKGDAAAAGFRELSELAHTIEDALTLESVSKSVSLAELGFAAADVFGAMISAYQTEGALPETAVVKALVQKLTSEPDKASQATTKESAPARAEVTWTEYETLSAETLRAEGKRCFTLSRTLIPCVLCRSPRGNWSRMPSPLSRKYLAYGPSRARALKCDALIFWSQLRNLTSC